jgi:hypothetical protein
MQNVVQNSATESVGNCVKHEVGHQRANEPPATTSHQHSTSLSTSTCAKLSNSSHHCNSVPKANHSTTNSKGNFLSPSNISTTGPHHRQPPDPSSSSGRNSTKTVAETTSATELALKHKQRRSYHHQYMPDSSDSDSDDVLSVSQISFDFRIS